MRSLLKIFVAGYALVLMSGLSVEAQAPRAGAAERDRGLWNRLGSRREERLNRNAPQPPPTQPAPAQPAPAQPAARAGAPGNTATARGPAANRTNRPPANQAAANSRPAASTPADRGSQAGLQPNGGDGASTNSARASDEVPNPFAAGYTPSSAASRNSLLNSDALRPAPSNRLPYNGPGVLIRLPERLRGEVNYLIDDEEHLIVHSGESQHLPHKDRYEVRFSRGVTADGQSYGEARYTITEGIYRFDVSASGWELYREGEGSEVAAAVRQARQRDAQVLQASAETSVGGVAPLPSPGPQADSTSEDTLPAPKSILEK